MSQPIPLLVRSPKANEMQVFPPLVCRPLTLFNWTTDLGHDAVYQPGDQQLAISEVWLTSLYVITDPNLVLAGSARVFVWDTKDANNDPAAAQVPPAPLAKMSNDLNAGDAWIWEPPPTIIRVVDGFQFNLGFHFRDGFRVQVVDTGNANAFIPSASVRIEATFIGCSM